jgi:hypothetical protein
MATKPQEKKRKRRPLIASSFLLNAYLVENEAGHVGVPERRGKVEREAPVLAVAHLVGEAGLGREQQLHQAGEGREGRGLRVGGF